MSLRQNTFPNGNAAPGRKASVGGSRFGGGPAPREERRVPRTLPFSHPIAYERDSRGKQRRRTYITNPPLIQMSAEALRKVSLAYLENPDEVWRYFPYLAVENAIEATDNVRRKDLDLLDENEVHNDHLHREIAARTQKLPPLRERERTLEIQIAYLLAGLPVTFNREALTVTFECDTALKDAQTKAAAPKPWWHVDPKVAVVWASAAVLSLAFGCKTDLFTFDTLASRWPVVIIAALVAAALMRATSFAIEILSNEIGEGVGLAERKRPRVIVYTTAALFALLAVAVYLIGRSESVTDQLGLYAGVSAKSFETAATTAGDFFFISLLVVVPVLLLSMVTGFIRGRKTATEVASKETHEDGRAAIRSKSEYVTAMALIEDLRFTRRERGELQGEIKEREDNLRHGLTDYQRDQKDEMEADLIAYNREVREALGIDFSRTGPGNSEPWWKRFLRGPSRSGRGVVWP